MPPSRKRRAQAEASPSPAPSRRRLSASADVSSVGDDDAFDGEEDDTNAGSHQQMVKNLVRLALACEFSRQPLRRADITLKGMSYATPPKLMDRIANTSTVLAPNSRAFKKVFASAQEVLRSTFGMTMTELPLREKITTTQKRAAQRAQGASQGATSSSNAYILTSTLPPALRTPHILPPSRIPSVNAEASYTGLYSFVISVVYLTQGGRISEAKLERVLGRVNASQWVAGDKVEKMLKRMEREGYIVKIRDREAGGEETVEWIVGPRGKIEVGERGVAGLVKSVYGKRDVELEELENKLEKSLGANTFSRKKRRVEEADGERSERDNEGQLEERSSARTNGTRIVPINTNSETRGASNSAAQRSSTRRTGRGRVVEEDEDDDDDEEDDRDEASADKEPRRETRRMAGRNREEPEEEEEDEDEDEE